MKHYKTSTEVKPNPTDKEQRSFMISVTSDYCAFSKTSQNVPERNSMNQNNKKHMKFQSGRYYNGKIARFMLKPA